MRLIYGILLFVMISACSFTPEVKETATPHLTEPIKASETKAPQAINTLQASQTSAPTSTDTLQVTATTVKTETIETPGIESTALTSVPDDGEKLTLMTSDGVQLAAFFYAPENLNEDTEILILVHEAYRGHRSWDEFRSAAHENGYAVIALDLRGHGQSSGDQVFTEAMDHDIDAVVDWISVSPDLNEDRIAIAGASVGANLALRAGARHPQIKSVVLLSPGMMYWEIGIEAAMLDYGGRPLLLVASEQDTYSATSVQRLKELGGAADILVLYPGAAHGTDMIRNQPDLAPMMFDWFEQTMD